MLEIKGDSFYLNDEKFNIYSGTIHYFRVLPEYWEDRLTKLKLAGFNTVETYCCWNLHEPKKGEFNFEGMLDLVKFIETAQKVGLYVILRPGPYICAEWDFGGLPAWLLKDKNLRLRCNNAGYLKHVEDYYTELLSRVNHLQITNGGNIIAMQIENEYGSYGNDKEYLLYIEQLMLKCGVNVMLFTADGNWCNFLSGGTLPHVYKTLTFGSKAKKAFNCLKGYQENAPKTCMEFWCGWFDHWGEKHHVRNPKQVAKELKDFLAQDANFNFYMFHGGTNFNFWAGANHGGKYQPTTTSYDYSALLSEWGGYTPAYHMVRDILHEHQGLEKQPLPPEPTMQSVGDVQLTERANLVENLTKIGTKHRSATPESMEYYGQNFGMILYHTEIKGQYAPMQKLTIEGIHDKAYIYINGQLKATHDRWGKKTVFGQKGGGTTFSMTMPAIKGSVTIDILVDAMGRVNYGSELYDRKGISKVTFWQQELFGWDVYTIPLDNIGEVEYGTSSTEYPAFIKGSFKASPNSDCFIHMDNFTRGSVFVNGFNLGRYWNVGPQMALYCPGCLLKEDNEIVVLEQVACANPTVKIDSTPDLGKTK